MSLYRGNYRLAHMSQVLDRDEKAVEIAKHFGKDCHAYMLTDEQLHERETTGRGGMPYRYLVRSPQSSALAWTAFYMREDMGAFLEAYGCTLDREPTPGESFRVCFPKDASAFLPIVNDRRMAFRTYGRISCVEVDASSREDALDAASRYQAGKWTIGQAADCGDFWRVTLAAVENTLTVDT